MSLRLPHVRRALPLALLLLLVSCGGSDRTSIQVVVSSSTLDVGEDVNRLQFEAVGRKSGQMLDDTFDIDGDWPHSLTILPGQSDREQVTISVRAYLDDELVKGVTRSRSGDPACPDCQFVPGEVQEVFISLEVEGMDGGMDAGMDAGRDAMPGDARPDAPDTGPDGGAECTSDEDCDDGVECTVDQCVAGACTNTPDDSVCEDGESCDATMGCPLRSCSVDSDCDDGEPCNGAEVCPDGRCRRGALPAERCNGMDDDCDELVDEDFDCVQGETGLECTTACDSTGTQRCDVDCSLTACEPPFETCNDEDDDCDGVVDEGFACMSCTDDGDCDDGNPCNGTERCNERGECEPGTPPTCDDGVRCTVDTCDPDVGCTHTPEDGFCDDGNFCNGEETCSATGCQPGIPPECDDGDDCTDDSCAGTAPGMCTHTTADADGDGFGDADCPETGGVPATDCDDTDEDVHPDATETCNGRDDDCDGMVDEDFDCAQGTGEECTTSCGTTGMRACDDSCTLGDTCMPPPEACNGEDDDCDGMVDETVECTAGEMASCTTSCGSTGSRTCQSDCTWEACIPPAESCNGEDDDCDGLVDEDFTCVPGNTRSCTTDCSTTGRQTCQSDCTWGDCEPPEESCNGMDDDCDGTCDNGFACCAGSSPRMAASSSRRQ
ncbi:MAG: putative metal-binding motif-containing protein, partial [Polyangiales bacterium]